MTSPPTLTTADRAFLRSVRRAVLATIAPDGRARPIPICFALDADAPILYSPLDDKPKSMTDRLRLARVRDIAADPRVTVLADHWDEDWTRLAWLRLTGTARLVPVEDERHAVAIRGLRARYRQYRDQVIEVQPLIAVDIERVTRWTARTSA